MKKSKNRFKALAELGLAIAILVVLNLIGQQVFARFDLTKEKRFSLSKPSKDIAKQLTDVVTIKVYLEGEFPAGFKRLQKATRDLIEEYKAYAGSNIEYEFIDPLAGSKNTNEILEQLMKKGLQPTNIQINEEDQQSQKIVVPGATISYKGGKEIPVNLMREQFGQDPEVVLNQSIENLEYEFSSAFKKCLTTRKKKIAFSTGHGEVESIKLNSIAAALSENFDFELVNLNDVPPNILNKYDLLFIVKPQLYFDQYERFKIDQYVMHGGKLFCFLENVVANMDSISKYEQYLTPTVQTGLDELLFKYGARVNYNLLSDRNCLPIQLTELGAGGSKKMVLKPWSYYPVFTEHAAHPITKNLEPVLGRFSGTIDTVGNKEIRKYILLRSSEYSRSISSPAMLSFGKTIQQYGDPQYFNKVNLPTAVLLEGNFTSFYKNYMTDTVLDFKAESGMNKMIIAADADLITNSVNPKSGETYPLGFDAITYQRTRTMFGNKKFILNCVDYLMDGTGLIDVRSKEFKIRMLDMTKVKLQKTKWRIINLAFPIIMLLIFMIVNEWIRKKKYSI
ncbi:MAG: gliding motility-associated ABC transporter substrate-binding protein GldG [Bacteroidetes bacterium]|nr:gliding motility-associated ABC transporter substrate-binding protein GldG [Bacteroidota bacterium]